MLKKSSVRPSIACPCRTPLEDVTYGECCAVFHGSYADAMPAPTPEALMRSRYSAYALGLIDYLVVTWHPSTAPGDLELGATKWVGLDVLHRDSTLDAGVVQFVAKFKDNGRAGQISELSRFVREDGRWLYVDGVIEAE